VDHFVDGLVPGAESAGVIVLAPLSTVGTWDAIHTTFGRDVQRVDAALRWVFSRWSVDRNQIAVSGFSDGGTYSLALGRANGDLFSQIIAFSPGFLIEVEPVRRPRVLITHGTDDNILPIDATSRRIVPELRIQGYEVDYREFAGRHAVPFEVAGEVMSSLARRAPAS
jgi:predicted esterase